MSRLMTKPTKCGCAPSEDSDQPEHPPSLIRVFAVRSVVHVAKDPSFLHADSKDWSDWADAQADLSLRWAHSQCVGCVTRRLIYMPSLVFVFLTRIVTSAGCGFRFLFIAFSSTLSDWVCLLEQLENVTSLLPLSQFAVRLKEVER